MENITNITETYFVDQVFSAQLYIINIKKIGIECRVPQCVSVYQPSVTVKPVYND